MKLVIPAIALVVSGIIGSAGYAQTASSSLSKEERIEPTDKQLALLQSLTPSDFQRTAVPSDSDLDTVAVINTSEGYKNKGRFTDRVRADNFLRAFIIKRTGVVRFQLYQSVSYNYEARNFTSVNYSTPDGPQIRVGDEHRARSAGLRLWSVLLSRRHRLRCAGGSAPRDRRNL